MALSQAGYSTESVAYRSGVAYLLRTQRPDGSWHVRSRRRDEVTIGQAYFETVAAPIRMPSMRREQPR